MLTILIYRLRSPLITTGSIRLKERVWDKLQNETKEATRSILTYGSTPGSLAPAESELTEEQNLAHLV
jgi:hypothetical protein